MISTSQFKNGIVIILDDQLYILIEFQHVKPGKGPAFVRTKLRNLKDGSVISKTFNAGEKFEEAFIEEKKLQYMYNTGDAYHFMDSETYEDLILSKELLGDHANFLKENIQITGSFYKSKLVDIALPIFVELKVEKAEPGLRGDTAKSTTKTVRLETGAEVQAPLFINEGDIIKIDTRTGAYIGRV